MTKRHEATIRPRRDDDLNTLARVLVAVHERDCYPVEGVADPHAWLALSSPLGAWVAEIDGQPVAHVALTEPGPGDEAARMWCEQENVSPDDVAVLGRLFVSPTARGHRLGSRLTQTATHAAQEQGRRAVLDVMLKDVAAIAVYKALGWRSPGMTQHHHSSGEREAAQAFVGPPLK